MKKTLSERKTLFRIELGAVIRNERKRIGCPQDEFAEFLGVHRTYLGGIERGERNITIDVFEKICNRLEIQMSMLVEQAEQKLSRREISE